MGRQHRTGFPGETRRWWQSRASTMEFALPSSHAPSHAPIAPPPSLPPLATKHNRGTNGAPAPARSGQWSGPFRPPFGVRWCYPLSPARNPTSRKFSAAISTRVPEVSGGGGEGDLSPKLSTGLSFELNVQQGCLVGNDSMFRFPTASVTVHRHIRNADLRGFDTPGTGGRSIGNTAPTFQERCADISGTGMVARIAGKRGQSGAGQGLNLSNLI